jgi:PAS domain S-box-containing protein
MPPWLGYNAPMLLLVLAVAAAAWHGGLRSGLLAVVLCLIVAAYFFLEPIGWSVAHTGDWLRLALFATVGGLISWLFEAMHRQQRQARDARNYAESVVDTVREPLVVLDNDLRVRSANRPFYQAFHVTPEDTENRLFYDLGNGQWNIPKLRMLLGEALSQNTAVHDFEIEHNFSHIGPRIMRLNARKLYQEGNTTALLLLAIYDITEQEWANRSVRESQELLRITLASIGDAIISTDTEGRITNLNAVAESLTGWKNSEARGLPLTQVFHIVNEFTRQAIESPALKALREGTIAGVANHTLLIAKDGTERPIDDSAAPIQDNQGHIAGCVLVFRDITERKQAETTLRYQLDLTRAITDNATTAIFMMDRKSRCTFMNPAAEVITGFTFEEANGQILHDLIHHHHPDGRPYPMPECPIDRALPEKFDVFGHEDMFIRKDGTFFPVMCHTRLISRDGVAVGTIIEVRDITKEKKAEAALRESEVHFRSMADNAPTMLRVTDPSASTTYLSKQWYEFTGGTPERDLGFDWLESVHPDDRQQVQNIFLKANEQYAPFSIDYRLRRHDGEYRWVISTGLPRFDEARQFQGYVGTVTDIHERKQMQDTMRESERRFRLLVEQVKDYAIFMTDPEGRATTWNEGVRGVLGFEEAEFIGQDIVPAIFTPEDVRSGVAQAELDQAAANGSANDDRWMRRKDGSRFWAVGVTTGLRDDEGKLLGFMKVMRNQTERKQLEDELRQIAAKLSESDRRKTEFLATLGHELRNPLAPICTGLEIMKMVKDDPATMEEIRGMMERQTQQMVRLIDDLLDVSRITRGKLELQTCQVALADVVRSAVEATRPFINEAGHELTVTLPPQPILLDADPNRLAQVFSNLLNNATKYTPERGHIRLTAERQGSDVMVTVKDNGIGIPADMQDGIFEMFTQIDRPLEKGYQGLGIGLTLVKRLVEMHGGRIKVHSEGIGKGSEFRVRLPILAESPIAEPQPVQDSAMAKPTRFRILVVDDNKAAADMLGRVVEMLGNEVRTAYGGLQGVEAAAEFRPDMVLMDLGMPAMNGYEATRSIREQMWGKDMVLVALTGWGQEEDKQRTKEAGFDYHLVKPAKPSELQWLLAALNKKKLESSALLHSLT